MNSLEIVGISILGSSAFYIPVFLRTLRRERKVIEDGKKLIIEERRQFFNAIQEKAASNATIQCRTCSICHRVVHRYDKVNPVICKECDIT